MSIILDGFEYGNDDRAQKEYGWQEAPYDEKLDMYDQCWDLVPTMTANNVPSPFVISASSELLPNYPAWQAFDDDRGYLNCWFTNASPTGWLKVDLGAGNEAVVRKYTLTCESHSTGVARSPRDWTLQGSNNDSDWDILDTQTGITPSFYQIQSFTFTNSSAYRYYKINVTANNGDASYLGIAQMELFTDNLGYTDFCYGGTPYAESILSASYPATNAFMNDLAVAKIWSTEKKGAADEVWIAYNFPSAKAIRRVRVYSAIQPKRNFKDFKIQGSNNSTDGSDGDWDDLATGLNTSDISGMWTTFDFANTTAYEWIRLIGAAQLFSGSDYYIQVREIEMYEALPAQCYSESSIKEQGDYSMKIVATTDALNNIFVKQVQGNLGFEEIDTLQFDIRASRTGSNFTFGFRNTSDIATVHTPNIASADTWQTEIWDISGVADADKDNIDQLILQIINADADNEIYIDNFRIIPSAGGKKFLRGKSGLS